MCNVNIIESLRLILDSEIDCSDDDDAWAMDDSLDRYEVSDASKTHNTVHTHCASLAYVGLYNTGAHCTGST